MLPPPIGRIGLAGAHAHVHKRDVEKRGTCNLATGDLYSFPNSSSTIDATTPLTFKWNTQCAMNSKVDLYLYEPTSANGVIHVWQNADFSAGQYTATLQPRWWNDTTTASLQLSILNAGAEPWDTVSPAGPVFKITYPASAMMTTTTVGGNVQTGTAAAAATESRDAVFQDVSSTSSSRGPSKAVIAVAVLIPLIVVGIAVAVAVRFWRAREAEKRKRWSQALSTHSGLEWEKGALPGEKPSSILVDHRLKWVDLPLTFHSTVDQGQWLRLRYSLSKTTWLVQELGEVNNTLTDILSEPCGRTLQMIFPPATGQVSSCQMVKLDNLESHLRMSPGLIDDHVCLSVITSDLLLVNFPVLLNQPTNLSLLEKRLMLLVQRLQMMMKRSTSHLVNYKVLVRLPMQR